MKSKDIIEKVDFTSFANSNFCDPTTRELLKNAKKSETDFLTPPEISFYDNQNKDTLASTIEIRAQNLASQGRRLNGANLCASSLRTSNDKAPRSWVPLETEGFLLIFIINAESLRVEGCMSLKNLT
ncbi:hypothetical protein ACTACL_09060 [Pseudomonas syringae]|uniref:hypothetical protein n=1 Tax=Pseudomonas syringae TaxID=317 RepID=UPI003F79969C